MSSIHKNWIAVSNWQQICSYLKNPEPICFLISAATLKRIGVPVIKSYQDFLTPYKTYSLIVECNTLGPAMSCIYHGIEKVLYRSPTLLMQIQSLSKKTMTQIISQKEIPNSLE